MTDAVMPRAALPFVEFASLVRSHGFAVAPEQTTAFLSAIDLLGPRNITDIRRAAHATMAPPVERRAEFDALFDALFMGQVLAAPAPGDDEDELRVQDDDAGYFEPETSDDINEAGQEAAGAEVLSQRQFEPVDLDDTLRRFARTAGVRLPQRKVRRRMSARAGDRFDLRRALRDAVKFDGDIIELPQLRRRMRQRTVLLLIDVSGSMKERTDVHLRFAHALVQAADRVEVFTFGTRLTRITRALQRKRADEALAAVSGMVADWDGGTRIGDALDAFLSVPRFVGLARGAVAIVLSDGLERGDHAAMTDAVVRLSRCAWQLHWLSPLAVAADFEPETAALRSIAPYLDSLADGSAIESICDHVLGISQGEAA